LIVRCAVALPPDPDSVPEPSTVWPIAKDTEPAGDVVPDVALTVAVKVVLALDVILVGFALTVVVEAARAAGGAEPLRATVCIDAGAP
jgi:hypothetical protein